MSDTEPIMRDHSDTSEEEQNELRKIAQDEGDDGIIGQVDAASSQVTSTLDPERRDEGDVAADRLLNDQEQRHG